MFNVRVKLIIAVLVLAMSFLSLFTQSAHAGSISIGCNTQELIDAINLANSDPSPDVINLSPGCTYSLDFHHVVSDANPNGLPVIYSGISFNGNGATIDGNHQVRLFYISNNPWDDTVEFNVAFNNLTLINGNATLNASTSTGGGAIYVGSGAQTVTVTNSTLVGNSAVSGGAIMGQSVTISNSVLSDNSAIGMGGALYTSGSGPLNISNSTIIDNTAGMYGGGIFAYNQANIANSTISGNAAPSGGGIVFRGASTLVDSTISGNVAQVGAGVQNGLKSAPNPNNTLITRSTISGNAGGGILDYGSNLTIEGGTIAQNTINGGIFVVAGKSTTMKNSIVALNTAAANPDRDLDIKGTINSQGFNLISTLSGTTVSGDATGNIYSKYPLLGPLADNGGPTLTHALMPGSPAIDAGNCVHVVDQRGMTRPIDHSGVTNAAGSNACDIGAYELSELYFNANADRYTTASNTTLAVTTVNGVLANDFDPQGLTLTASKTSNPANGTLNFNSNGSFSYVPNLNFVGSDSFSYTVSNGVNQLVANVVINVTTGSVSNTPPVAVDDVLIVVSGGQVSSGGSGVLNNDFDLDGNSLMTVQLVNGPTNGTLIELNANGSYVYMAGEQGSDSFTYSMSDGTDSSNVGTVHIIVAPRSINLQSDSYSMPDKTNTMVVNEANGLLANDIHPLGLSMEVVRTHTLPGDGTIVFNSNGSFSYTPPSSDFRKTVTFNYAARDQQGNFAFGNVVINVFDNAPYDLHITGSGVRPDYHWSVDSLSATYRLEVSTAQGTVLLSELYSTPAICDATSCNAYPDLNLNPGTYSFRVIGWTVNSGYTPWSRSHSFTVDSDGIPNPGIIEKISPERNAFLASGGATFQWRPDDYASWYRVNVTSLSGANFEQWYKGDNVCTGNSCAAQMALPDGKYTWYIIGWGPGGMGVQDSPATAGTPFYVGQLPPGTITQVAPSNGLTLVDAVSGVNFQWLADETASWYRLVVTGAGTTLRDEWYKSSDICVNGTCQVLTPNIRNGGGYVWYVAGWNVSGVGKWGTGWTFGIQVPKPDQIVQVAPVGTIEDTPVVFQWEPDPNAKWYQLRVAGGVQSFVFDQWLQGEQVCSDSLCTYAGLPLTNGSYTWWVNSWGPGGLGPADLDGTNFSIGVERPGLVNRIAPTGDVSESAIAFEWVPDTRATYYRLYVNGPAGKVIDRWLEAENVCTSELCTYRDSAIKNGNYSWWMQAWGPGGMGEFDLVSMDFILDLPLPGLITLTSPQEAETLAGSEINLVWQADANASWYQVQLYGPDAYALNQWYDIDQVCENTVCSIALTLNPGAYSWTMRAWGPGGTGPVHPVATSFTVSD